MKLDLENKKVVVAGMGRSGVAAVELLLRHGARVTAADEKAAPDLGEAAKRLASLGVPLVSQSADQFAGADIVVLSPGVPVDVPAVVAARNAGAAVIGEVELAGYFLKGPVLGITGSNGKTTTTAMAGHILGVAGIPRQVGGNIGTPPTSMIDSSRADQWNVFELSSFQLETVDEFSAKVAAVLNITPDHLDRHGALKNYANAKARLLETQRGDAFAVLNADDPMLATWAGRTRGEVHWFSRSRKVDPGVYLDGDRLVAEGRTVLTVGEIPLRGIHNVENTMAAIASTRLAGASFDGIAEGVRTFPGVEHRIEFVREREGVAWYNDSKATNVDATEKAIDAFAGGLWIILGGKDKNSDYTVLRDKLAAKSKGILLIGKAAEKIASHLGGLPLVDCKTIDKAVEYAASNAAAGDTVLLAPACASFDQFQSYEHRGRVFKELVRAL